VQESVPNTWYTIDRVMLPVLVAWGLVRDHPDLDAEAGAEIEAWLGEVMQFRKSRPEFPDMPSVARINHLYLRDSVDMAWGALVGDDALFRRGFRSFEVALKEMHADGSLPLEVQRGARALWYQRHAIACRVAISERAAVQGQYLYSRERDGRSLHAAVSFLLDGLDDPTIVWSYARANVSPGPFANYRVQDLGFMRTRGHGRHYMAWVEAYLARFPERAESRRLAKALETHDPDYRPMIDEYVGGAASCFFARADGPSG
jgi:poly(beta-D-mannuronate) lyase